MLGLPSAGYGEMVAETRETYVKVLNEGAVGSLEKVEPFDRLRPKTKEALKANGFSQSFSKGQMIFVHGDPASRFYFIEKGWVKLFRETLGGDEAVLDVLPPGSVFGETAFCEGGIYTCSAEAIEDACLRSCPSGVLEHEIVENADFMFGFLEYIAAKGLKKDREIELRSVQNAAQRIGCFILRLCGSGKESSATVCLPWEKSLIAARLGMAPETFSRGLARLQKDIKMRIDGNVIEISNMKALVRYTCAACSNIFPCNR